MLAEHASDYIPLLEAHGGHGFLSHPAPSPPSGAHSLGGAICVAGPQCPRANQLQDPRGYQHSWMLKSLV